MDTDLWEMDALLEFCWALFQQAPDACSGFSKRCLSVVELNCYRFLSVGSKRIDNQHLPRYPANGHESPVLERPEP
jgi:hypothetical protein